MECVSFASTSYKLKKIIKFNYKNECITKLIAFILIHNVEEPKRAFDSRCWIESGFPRYTNSVQWLYIG
jgi:hypothetical protein